MHIIQQFLNDLMILFYTYEYISELFVIFEIIYFSRDYFSNRGEQQKMFVTLFFIQLFHFPAGASLHLHWDSESGTGQKVHIYFSMWPNKKLDEPNKKNICKTNSRLFASKDILFIDHWRAKCV